MSTLQFAETHNMIAFLEKPAESNGFQEIIDFLNANQIHYALTVNPTIYTSCIEQFWATAKAKTVNGERQLQALVDKKKVIITETSIRSDLHLEDAGGTDCLPTATIFEELARMGYEKPSQRLTFYKAFFSPQWKFLIHTITQCLSAKTTTWNEFSSTMASAIICLATNQKFNLSKYIFDAMKKQSRRKQRKETEVPQDESHHDDSIHIPSNEPLLSGEDRMQLTKLMILCTNLQKRVLDLEKAKDAQAKEIIVLKKREDASNQGRSFEDIDKDAEVSLVDETQGRTDDAEMFDTNDLHGDEVIVDMAVTEKQEQSAKIDEITLVQTLIEIKAAKPKAITIAATKTTTRPKARGVVVQKLSEFRTTTSSPQASQPSKTKDKGKAIMIEPEVPLKRKDQVALDKEMARNLEAQLQAELIEEKRLARKKEEEANIALIESWENTQAMIEADRLLAERLQTREQEELTDEEKAKIFIELMEKRRKYFVALRAQDKRNRPPTKTQKRNQMSIYLKHMGGYKHNQLKGRSYDEIQKLFDKEIKRVNSFVAMNTEAQEISRKKDESSSKKAEIAQDSSTKRAWDKLESDKSKKQKTDENEEVKVDNEVELKEHMVTVKDDDIAIDAIPLATKPPVIVEYKLIREGIMAHYQLIRADGSFKRYSSMIRML
ncbi:hypothetical protein Tco_0702670 [Tanacetum coccineum]|uniref:Xylulose kinase-1 n=1 Tax=Tanacetum coccineum TaxID=301880 RepID=A0ABQ4XWN8_9ASTR